MRQKKAIINSSVNILTFVITFIPQLILRKVFLDILGEDLLGLNSLYTNIIGWLSIVELGVGTAIIFSLYKPFAENDHSRVRAYLDFYKRFYVITGFIVLVLGLIVTPFLKLFIDNQDIDISVVTLGFIFFLLNSFITYLFSSRLCILNVAQEGYKITIGTTLAKLVILVLQLIILKIYPNFILFTAVQVLVNLVFYILINRYTLTQYPWINEEKNTLEDEEKKRLLRSVKAMFMHKIGTLFVFSTDSLVISRFVGLASLAKYTNYYTITSAIERFMGSALQGITASVGNMLIERDSKYASDIHKKVFFINFWITSFVTISLANTLDQFVGLWVGEEYLLDKLTFTALLINFYFVLMRGSIERFKEASGNYVQDRFAPLVEGLVNLVSSLILVQYMGLSGVLVGTLISNFTVLFWVQPYVVYKYVFKERLINYISMYLRYTLITLIMLLITHYVTLPWKNNFNLIDFIINCCINIVVINGIYIVLFHRKKEFSYLMRLIKIKKTGEV